MTIWNPISPNNPSWVEITPTDQKWVEGVPTNLSWGVTLFITGYLLNEDGSYILTEDGNRIEIESFVSTIQPSWSSPLINQPSWGEL